MSTEFIETGQTLTGDGHAICPVERKPRGVAGIVTAIAVLFAGAAFLTFAAFSPVVPIEADEKFAENNRHAEKELIASSTPIDAAEVALVPIADTSEPDADGDISDQVDAAETIVALEAITDSAPTAKTPGSTTSPKSTLSSEEIEAVLAASRLARASIPVAPITAPDPDRGFAPRLKPTAAGNAQNTGFAPSLKPSLVAEAAAALAQNTTTQNADVAQIENAPAEDQTSIPEILSSLNDAPIEENTPAPLPTLASQFLTNADENHQSIDKIPAPVYYAADLQPELREVSVKIKRGENFVDALKRAGVNTSDRNDAAQAFGKHYNLRRLLPGQEFAMVLGTPNQTVFEAASSKATPQPRLVGLEFRPDFESQINLRWAGEEQLVGTKTDIPLTTQIQSVAGEIEGSLYLSAKAQGATGKVIADLANTFAYDVDFQREIYGGDEYEVLYEAKYDDRKELVGSGDILYARLNWRGRKEEKGYYRFEDEKGIIDFYDGDGSSAKRLLMKTPIDGARLSSRFGTRRHPILGYRRAHKGVDFAAPRGTPIKAAGDGVIERADRFGSFGNYVKIRHANGYKTAYAHLKSFRRGIRKGKRVRQGDIIGYVGTTGRSTGPHLHYEVHLHGKAVNPQKLKISTGKKLKGAELEHFQVQREAIDLMRAQKNPVQAEQLIEIVASGDGTAIAAEKSAL